jgi:signal transduction histidine kinase
VPPEPVEALVDSNQFGTVLVNLMLNALDAMPHGGVLEVGIDASGGEIQFVVCDTGAGIAPEMLDRLFVPFASTKPTGTGLGLSISRRIIEEHGGRIAAENLPEGGARFTVNLPAPGGETQQRIAV